MSKTIYIINPSSHGGAGTFAWNQFKKLWPNPIDPSDVIVTERGGQAQEIAAARTDCEVIVAVGGDGTVGEVISGVMEQKQSKSKVAVIPCGTGNDIARHASIFSIQDSVDALLARNSREFDLIRINYQKDGAQKQGHAFLFGLAGFSTNHSIRPWMKRLLGAKKAYFLATFLQILVYKAPKMTIHADDQEFIDTTYMVIAGNSEYAGGASMRLSPNALIDDGELNITIIPSMSRYKVLTRLFPGIADGTHIDRPGVLYFAGKKIEVQSDPPVSIEIDGDMLGTTPATFCISPKAIELIHIKAKESAD